MDFNFMQCGTDYPDSNNTDIVYRNVIQNQEYYEHIYLGVLVSHLFKDTICFSQTYILYGTVFLIWKEKKHCRV